VFYYNKNAVKDFGRVTSESNESTKFYKEFSWPMTGNAKV
jgi:hypothetical protein